MRLEWDLAAGMVAMLATDAAALPRLVKGRELAFLGRPHELPGGSEFCRWFGGCMRMWLASSSQKLAAYHATKAGDGQAVFHPVGGRDLELFVEF